MDEAPLKKEGFIHLFNGKATYYCFYLVDGIQSGRMTLFFALLLPFYYPLTVAKAFAQRWSLITSLAVSGFKS